VRGARGQAVEVLERVGEEQQRTVAAQCAGLGGQVRAQGVRQALCCRWRCGSVVQGERKKEGFSCGYTTIEMKEDQGR